LKPISKALAPRLITAAAIGGVDPFLHASCHVYHRASRMAAHFSSLTRIQPNQPALLLAGITQGPRAGNNSGINQPAFGPLIFSPQSDNIKSRHNSGIEGRIACTNPSPLPLGRFFLAMGILHDFLLVDGDNGDLCVSLRSELVPTQQQHTDVCVDSHTSAVMA